jgi:hypothetical protein
MDYKIIPIAMTRVAWGDYIEFVKDILGYSPTRGLDDAGINPAEPQAYLATLNLENKPNKQLSNYDDSWEHVHCSFMACMPKSLVIHFYQAAPKYKIKLYNIPDDDNLLILMTANIISWKETIIYGCRRKIGKKIRIIYNQIMQYLEQAGFKMIWSDFEKQDIFDGTFILRRR